MVLYHAIASQYLYFSQWEHQTIHFSFLFLLIFMSYARKTSNKAVKFLLYACMLVTLICCAYVYLNTEELEMSQGFPTQAELGPAAAHRGRGLRGLLLPWTHAQRPAPSSCLFL